MAKSSSFFRKFLIALLLTLFIGGASAGYLAYRYLYQSNVSLGDKKSQVIYIHTGWNFDDVVNMLQEKNIIINRTSFVWMAKRMHYPENVKPGKYRVMANTGNRALIRMLQLGKQEPVSLPLDNIHTRDQLVSRVCLRLEADSTEMAGLLNDNGYLQKFAFDRDNVMALFRPNTYEFFWNTSCEEFIGRMADEYKKFWTDDRKKKAKAMNMKQSEVIALASIVEMEQSRFNDEKPIIAGLYINRLKIKMCLQADPTLIFALGDFTINRVLDEHKEIDSPYNTYKCIGLPPGPICLPEDSSVDAVLNYDHNDYLYFCAKEDFSGRHNFAKSYEQQKVYARKYREALDKRNIKK